MKSARPFAPRHSLITLSLRAALATSVALNASSVLAQAREELSEIVVTAQKREQSLMEVSQSVDVIRTDRLDMISASGQDILFLAAQSPSLYAESSSGRTFPRFYIRGLGNTDFDLNASQPVSLVYDEVVLENAILKGFPVFDMDRVEVLRGPQGTLFGRNTPAGVIKFESVKPGMEPNGYVRGSYGRFGTTDIEGAFGAPLDDDTAFRVSGLHQQRDDFVDNTFDGGESGFEEFEESAARFQVLYAPDEAFTALVNLHGRSLDGGSRLFRANIITPGTRQLVPGFNLFETGQDATQILKMDNIGASLKLDWQLGKGELTSVTAYETVEITARGDVDGGYGADFAPPVGRGAIPFAAESADNITDHHQFTQELRYTFQALNSFTGTLGGFLFDENLEIENLSFDTLSAGALNGLAVQDQDSRSVALFASGEWQTSDKLALNGGLRLSREMRDFTASRLLGPFGAPPLGPVRRDLDDTVLSGDLGFRYALTDRLSVHGRYARSFRAPSVQGRIVFGDAVTVADTETIDSLEFGFKSVLLDGKAFVSGAVYGYVTRDQQLTAVGGAGNFNQLLNADRVRGSGLELDAQWQPTPDLQVTAGYSLNETEIDDRNLQVAVCDVGCTVLDPRDPVTGNALIDGNPLPQAPRHIANLTAQYTVGLPGAARLRIATDVSYRSDINFFLYESVEFGSPSLTQVGLRTTFVASDDSYEVAAFVRNATDKIVVNGGIDFNNYSGFVNDPRIWGFEVLARF